MACFIAPATAAVAVVYLQKKVPKNWHPDWLLALLTGGVFWLIPEHIYHGEVVFYPPFLTAGINEIIPEVLKVGVPMILATMAVWMILLFTSNILKVNRFKPQLPGLMIFGAAIMVLVDKILA